MKTTFIIAEGQEMLAPAQPSAQNTMRFYAGTPVLRASKSQLFHLSFSMDDSAADFSFLNSGNAPFVYDHIEDVAHTLGTIQSAWMDGAALASVEFGEREEIAGLVNDIKSRKLKNVSMGVEVLETSKAPSVATGVPHYMATKWRPYHISLVSRGADHNAQFLSDCEMEVPLELTDISAPTGAASEADDSEQKARLALQIKQRRFRVLGR